MHNKKVLIFSLILIPAVIFSSCKKKGDEVVVNIDGDKITANDFNRYYYMQNKIMLNLDKKDVDRLAADPSSENHPTLNKTHFMDFLVSRELLYNKAMQDDSIDKEKIKTMIELSKMQTVANYYLMEKLKDEIKVTDAEADQFYKQNIKMFKGVPIDDQLITKIKQRIFLQKMEKKSNQFIFDLQAESKVNREGFKKYLNSQKKKDTSEEKKEDKKTEKKEKDTK